MNDKLYLKGVEYTLQEWTKCNVISKVKFISKENIKSKKILIIRSPKKYPNLF